MKIRLFFFLLCFPFLPLQALKVVTSIPPLYSLAAQLMEGADSPVLLLKGNQSPHTYSLTPSTASLLEEADILFWIGPELETFLKKPLEALKVKHIPLIETQGLTLYPLRSEEAWHGGDHDGHDHGHEGGRDPHLWLDLQNALLTAQRMKETLISLDRERQPLYEKNYAKMKASFEALQEELREKARQVKGAFMVYHDSLQYFEKAYGILVAGVVAVIPELQPNLKYVQHLKETISSKNVRCLFSESEFSPALIKRLSEQTGAPHKTIDPLGLAFDEAPDLYQRMMRRLMDDVKECGEGVR